MRVFHVRLPHQTEYTYPIQGEYAVPHDKSSRLFLRKKIKFSHVRDINLQNLRSQTLEQK